ncbi:MAG: pyrroline-5-carboxylate reductase [Alphaproteobacteria bacterium]
MSLSPDGAVLLVGGGRMGGALAAGWLARGMAPAEVSIIEPDDKVAAALVARLSVRRIREVSAWPDARPPAVVLFAIKPQTMDAVVPDYRRFVGPDTLFLSIAAGRTLGGLTALLAPADAPLRLVRAMPNTPAAVGRGMTVLCAGAGLDTAGRDLATGLMAAVGDTAWVADESLMDAVTAVSGSGPAYVFLLAEALAEAGIAAGLDADLARRLARQTVTGAGELMYRAEETPADLRAAVTSPGGTTAAALQVLMGPDGWQDALTRAVAAATQRSRQLAG